MSLETTTAAARTDQEVVESSSPFVDQEMNSNNWLSFPLSPPHSSLPSHLHASHPHHHFSLGLVSDSMDNPIFQPQEWSLMNGQSCNSTNGGDQVPKVADFLGVSSIKCDQENNHQSSSSEQQHHLQIVGFNESDYLYPSSSVVPLVTNYDQYQEGGNNLQSLTLSMGGGGTSSASGKGSSVCETSEDNSTNNNNNNAVVAVAEPTAPRRTLDTFGQRTSIYRGVTRHRWTGRYEAHLWDNTCRREGQSRKGRQVYLGGYDKEEKAARAYDLAALKYWGTSTTTNFPISNYEKEVEDMKNMTRQEFVASIRRKSSGFSRGASMYRGVTRHHQHGRWQARIGRVAGNKDLYLGTFSTEEEAAEAYDIAAIKFRGLSAVTNFEMSRYDVKSILESNSLPIGGGAAKRLKEAQAIETSRKREEMIALRSSSALPYGILSTTPSSSSARLQSSSPYSLMQSTPYDHPHHQLQPFLSLQNQAQDTSNISQFYATSGQDSSNNYQNYLQTQLHLHQQSMQVLQQSHPHQQQQIYNSYLQSNNPGLMHGMWNMGMESSGSGCGGGGGGGGDQDQPGAALVKVDYDQVPSGGGGFGNWSGESGVQGSNPGVFTMWNE